MGLRREQVTRHRDTIMFVEAKRLYAHVRLCEAGWLDCCATQLERHEGGHASLRDRRRTETAAAADATVAEGGLCARERGQKASNTDSEAGEGSQNSRGLGKREMGEGERGSGQWYKGTGRELTTKPFMEGPPRINDPVHARPAPES